MRRALCCISLFCVGLVGCGGSPIGAQCKLTSGTLGFGFDDPCASKCLELEKVICPDGTAVQEAICAGAADCVPGGCPDGQVCYWFEDPFDEESWCIPADFCGSQSAEALAAWEREARARSDAMREKYRERMARRTGQVSAPAAKPPPPSAPDATLATTPTDPTTDTSAAVPGASVLVDAWGTDLALVACVMGDRVATGGDCAQFLPAGVSLSLGGWRLLTTGEKRLACPASSATYAGIVTRALGADEAPATRWGWVPAPPPGWRPTRPAPLDPALAAIVGRELERPGARLDVAATADLDGDPHLEKIVRAFYASDDPDKPGFTSLWLIDDDAVLPLPTLGLDINGVASVEGIVPLTTGGALLVLTSQWMGGAGVHVLGPRNGTVEAIAEVSCGS